MSSEKRTKPHSNDFINLNNLVVRHMGNNESPLELLLPGSGPTPVFAAATQNSMNGDPLVESNVNDYF